MKKQRILLERSFRKLGIQQKNIEQFCLYLEILSEWNRHIALISKRNKDIINHLLEPSLLFFKIFKNSNLSIVDIGSGGGFPAIAIKIYEPSLNITMIETNSKKCAFLTYVCAKLNSQCNIINKRVEEIETTLNCDVITVRALKILPLIEKIKKRISGGHLLYITSKDNHLTIPPKKEHILNNYCARLYRFKELVG